MRLNILIGGKAGQGINKVSEIISNTLTRYGYFVFNYRDYPSLIRGGHNFNILSASEEKIESHDNKIDFLITLDEETEKIHLKELKKECQILSYKEFENEGRNLNIALAGALIKTLGIPIEELENEIKREFPDKPEPLSSAQKGYNSKKAVSNLKKIEKKIWIMDGSKAIAKGAINSNLDVYIAYPMTPATNTMHEIAKNQLKNKLMVLQAENEIAVANMALGASFTGAKTMVGTSGGGFDLMTEAISFQGISGIPLTIYLASRPGPGTGVPTYSAQEDLDIALRGGHGEFPRVVVAPSNPLEAIEKTNEALYLAEEFKTISIILSDKHLAESEFSTNEKIKKPSKIKISRALPGEKIIRASSYEINKELTTTESPEIVKQNADARTQKYEKIKKFIEKKFEMIKIYGNKKSDNLIIGWGSTSGAIKDAIKGLDCKFLQVLYIKPLSKQIKKEMSKAKNIILVEQNVTGQLGRLLREKTGISVPRKKRILKYDGKPFTRDELNEEIRKKLK
ncbi:MAG: 2-oxoacid:acceptor oxidoreductase family protein [Candidatus Pacearchaeota archaeon]